jgi:hypothetical protein
MSRGRSSCCAAVRVTKRRRWSSVEIDLAYPLKLSDAGIAAVRAAYANAITVWRGASLTYGLSGFFCDRIPVDRADALEAELCALLADPDHIRWEAAA